MKTQSSKAASEHQEDPGTVYRAMPMDGDAKERFETVRKEALMHRASRAWKELRGLGTVRVALWADGVHATLYLDGTIFADGIEASQLQTKDAP